MLCRALKGFGGCICFLAALSLARAEKRTIISLIPAANWRLVNSQALELDAVRKWGGDPVIEREYSAKSLELRTYRLNDTLAEALVEEAQDASSAYGLLTYYQTETMTPEKGMELTVTGSGGSLMGRGRYFIRIARQPAAGPGLSDNDFRALLIFVGGTRLPPQVSQTLPAPLPKPGLIPGTEKYLLGLEAARRVLPAFRTDLIGFTQGAEARVANYQAGKARVTVLAIDYPTPQIARVRFGAMQRFLGINQERGHGSLFGRRQGTFVFLVLDADSSAIATNLLDEFKVTEQLSWDERYPGDKPITIQMAELILANVILTLILVSFAIVGGILIFLSRRIAAKWFPESPWGHPDEGSIIRLNLSQPQV